MSSPSSHWCISAAGRLPEDDVGDGYPIAGMQGAQGIDGVPQALVDGAVPVGSALRPEQAGFRQPSQDARRLIGMDSQLPGYRGWCGTLAGSAVQEEQDVDAAVGPEMIVDQFVHLVGDPGPRHGRSFVTRRLSARRTLAARRREEPSHATSRHGRDRVAIWWRFGLGAQAAMAALTTSRRAAEPFGWHVVRVKVLPGVWMMGEKSWLSTM